MPPMTGHNFPITPLHVQESKAFQEGLKTLYETLQASQRDDEEIAVFYEAGKDTIRVYRIQMTADVVLVLAGLDGAGNPTAVAGHFKSMNLVYKKIKRTEPQKERTPIGFFTETQKK